MHRGLGERSLGRMKIPLPTSPMVRRLGKQAGPGDVGLDPGPVCVEEEGRDRWGMEVCQEAQKKAHPKCQGGAS